MKTKLLTFAKNNALILVALSYIIYLTIDNGTLKRIAIKAHDDKVKELKRQNNSLQIEKDSLTKVISVDEKIIDSLKNVGVKLENQRTNNSKRYEQKINRVNTASVDSISKFLSNYKYSRSASQGNN